MKTTALSGLLLATMTQGLVTFPYKPHAPPGHGFFLHHSPSHSTLYIQALTAAKHARLLEKLHSRNITGANVTWDPPIQQGAEGAQDGAFSEQDFMANMFQHAFDPVYDFLNDMIEMITKPRKEPPPRPKRHAQSILY